MAEVTLKDISKDLDSQKKVQESTDKNIKKISDNMSAFLKMAQGNKLKDRETELEKKKPKTAKEGGMISGIAESGIGTMIIGFAKKFGLLIAGLIGAALALFDETFNDLARTVAAFSKGFVGSLTAKALAPLALIIEPFANALKNGYEKIVKFLKGSLFKFLMLGEDGKPVSKLVENADGKKVLKGANAMTKFFRFISDFFGKISDFVSGPVFKTVGAAAKGLGSVLKILFAPIGIILTLFDVVKGAIEGAGGSVNPQTGEIEGDGIIGVITGAATGFFKSIFGAPANLLKTLTTWTLTKLGLMDQETKDDIDKNFDFEKIIEKFGKAVARFIDRAIDFIMNFDVADAISSFFSSDKTPLTAEEQLKKFSGVKAALEASTNPMEGQDVAGARKYIEETFGGKRQEQLLALLDQMEKNEMNKGTMGAFGTLFKDFGKGTPAILHGEEAVIPKNSQIGSMLGQLMDASTPMARFGNQKGRELKAKEDAMRAAGYSDMEIAQAMMGDMGGIMSGLKGAVSAGGLDKLRVPKMDTSGMKDFMQPQNIGSIFGNMVRESEEAKRSQAAQQPAPVIINDNSSQSGGTTNTAMPIQSQPFDFNDPFVKGLRMA